MDSGSRDEAGRHALVLGGGMAGLLAARVLSDHFARVTVLERDRYPEGPAARRGAPQARHAHVLLMRGQDVLERLFPGLCAEVAGAGAPVVDSAEDVAWYTPAGWGRRYPSRLRILSSTRDLLEWAVRHRVAALPRVRFLQGAEVAGLIPDGEGGVAGAWVRARDGEAGGEGRKIEADLVVDASGRGSRAAEWLRALGYEPPAETVVDARLGYASRLYRRPADFSGGWAGLFLQRGPDRLGRGGLVQPVEGGRWVVTLTGRGGDYPPTDEAGFLEFARALPRPDLYEAIRGAEPLSPISGFRATANRRRHFEAMKRLPERLLVLGDAACAFNPVYGQGMTAAALGAEVLQGCLSEQRGGGLRGLARRFQRRLAEANDAPWQMATAEDFRDEGVAGPRPGWLARRMRGYVDGVVRLGTRDAGARQAFLEVMHLLRPPSSLFRPGLVLRVLGQAVLPAREGAGRGSAPALT